MKRNSFFLTLCFVLNAAMCFAQETYHIFGIDAAGDGHTPPWTYNYGVSVNEL